MLNAKSGLVDFIKPNTGTASDKRPGTSGQSSEGSFGDTLRGQMTRSADERDVTPKGASQRPEKPKAPGEVDVSAADKTDNGADQLEQAQLQEPEADAAAQTDEEAMLVTPMAQPVVDLPEEAIVSSDRAAAEIAIDDASPEPGVAETGGKELPLMVPFLAAREGESGAMPRWLQLQTMERGSGKAVSASTSQQASAVLAGQSELLPSEESFLHGLRTAMGQRGNESEAGLGEGMTKGQSAEALFKLAGMSLSKEAPLAPSASSVVANGAAPSSLTPAGTPPLPQLALNVPLRQPGWDQAFAERVVWLARQGLQQAEIQLNPRNMGPIEVHVSVDKDQASVTFMAQHAVTREALEAALPRLREMLQGNGLNLAQSEVSQHSFGQQQREAMGFAGEQGRRGQGEAEMAEQDDVLLAETTLEAGRGLSAVDYYA